MKVIEREWVVGNGLPLHPYPKAKFINTGIWADGHLAYSRLDDQGNVIEEDEGMFVQIRFAGKLIMERI